MVEQTLIILKPDCVQRGLTGEVLSRFEKKGLKIVAMKFMLITKEKAESHYAEHKGKDFFAPLVEFITSSPVVVLVMEGEDAIQLVRKLTGATKAMDALPGTIRGDFSIHNRKNLVHASDSPESSRREIHNFFDKSEIIHYTREIDSWLKG